MLQELRQIRYLACTRDGLHGKQIEYRNICVKYRMNATISKFFYQVTRIYRRNPNFSLGVGCADPEAVYEIGLVLKIIL